MSTAPTPLSAASAERLLRASAAFVWLATGLLVVHPAYRAEGMRWLAPLRLGAWVMVATCAAEVILAGVVLLRPMSTWLALAQTGPIVAFTVILAAIDPRLAVHPFGVLTKNLQILTVIWTAWLIAREGFSPRAERLLRAGMALVWITEGIFPKLLFQSPLEIDVVRFWGFPAEVVPSMIRVTGVAQAISGVLVLVLRGRARRLLLAAQLAALLFLPLLVTVPFPLTWGHPFGPLTKNAVILAGTFVLWRGCTRTSS